VVLELGQFRRIFFGEDVNARGQELPDLDQYTAHLDHAFSQNKGVLCVKPFEPFFSYGRGSQGVSEREDLIAQKDPEKKSNAPNKPDLVFEY
jgi:hypothetical protein